MDEPSATTQPSKGEGFKEAKLNGNEEKGNEEESRQEKETLNDPGGA